MVVFAVAGDGLLKGPKRGLAIDVRSARKMRGDGGEADRL
jgi:hypothetical protein